MPNIQGSHTVQILPRQREVSIQDNWEVDKYIVLGNGQVSPSSLSLSVSHSGFTNPLYEWKKYNPKNGKWESINKTSKTISIAPQEEWGNDGFKIGCLVKERDKNGDEGVFAYKSFTRRYLDSVSDDTSSGVDSNIWSKFISGELSELNIVCSNPNGFTFPEDVGNRLTAGRVSILMHIGWGQNWHPSTWFTNNEIKNADMRVLIPKYVRVFTSDGIEIEGTSVQGNSTHYSYKAKPAWGNGEKGEANSATYEFLFISDGLRRKSYCIWLNRIETRGLEVQERAISDLKKDPEFINKVSAAPIRPNLLKDYMGKVVSVEKTNSNYFYRQLVEGKWIEDNKAYVASADFELVDGELPKEASLLFKLNGSPNMYSHTPLNGKSKGRVSIYIPAGVYNTDGIFGYAGRAGKTKGVAARYSNIKLEEVQDGEPKEASAYLPHTDDLKVPLSSVIQDLKAQGISNEVKELLKADNNFVKATKGEKGESPSPEEVLSTSRFAELLGGKLATIQQQAVSEAVKQAAEMDKRIKVGGRNLIVTSRWKAGYLYGTLEEGVAGEENYKVLVGYKSFRFDPVYIPTLGERTATYKLYDNGGLAEGNVQIHAYDKDQKFLWWSFDGWDGSVGRTVTWTLPADTAYIRLGVTNGNVRAKVEFGTVATDWTPAPEDVAESVSKVSTSLVSLTNQLLDPEQGEIHKLADLLGKHKEGTDKSLAELSDHPLTIDKDGYWRIWNIKQQQYVTTQYQSRGRDGLDGKSVTAQEVVSALNTNSFRESVSRLIDLNNLAASAASKVVGTSTLLAQVREGMATYSDLVSLKTRVDGHQVNWETLDDNYLRPIRQLQEDLKTKQNESQQRLIAVEKNIVKFAYVEVSTHSSEWRDYTGTENAGGSIMPDPWGGIGELHIRTTHNYELYRSMQNLPPKYIEQSKKVLRTDEYKVGEKLHRDVSATIVYDAQEIQGIENGYARCWEIFTSPHVDSLLRYGKNTRMANPNMHGQQQGSGANTYWNVYLEKGANYRIFANNGGSGKYRLYVVKNGAY